MSTILQFVVPLIGVVPAIGFLMVHGRPARFFRQETINATGWIVIVVLSYLRTLSLLLLKVTHHQTLNYGSPTQATTSIALGVAIDALVILRLVSFLRWRRAYRATLSADTQQAAS